jgi:hypothetical protein
MFWILFDPNEVQFPQKEVKYLETTVRQYMLTTPSDFNTTDSKWRVCKDCQAISTVHSKVRFKEKLRISIDLHLLIANHE